jgi:hypothetical protein
MITHRHDKTKINGIDLKINKFTEFQELSVHIFIKFFVRVFDLFVSALDFSMPTKYI